MSSVKTVFKSEQNKKFFDFLRKYGKKKVAIEVGIRGDSSKNRREELVGRKVDEEATTNLEVAVVNEFGSEEENIPERSFVRASVRTNAKKYLELRRGGIKLILNGKITADEFLENLGEIARSDMKEYATELSEPPNSPITIARKKSSNPLVHTSQMINAIDYQIVEE